MGTSITFKRPDGKDASGYLASSTKKNATWTGLAKWGASGAKWSTVAESGEQRILTWG